MKKDNKDYLQEIDDYFHQLHSSNDKKSAPMVVFGISLKSKKVSRDWDLVCENLAKTLRTILANTDHNFRICIAGHERPDIAELEHDLVTWIPVNFEPPVNAKGFSTDKKQKRGVIGAYLRHLGYSGYFMPLDADDWVHCRFVELIRSFPITNAFIFEKGFMTNINYDEVWIRNTFYKGCGSGSIFYFSNQEFPVSPSRKDVRRSPFGLTVTTHTKITGELNERNISFRMIELPMVTYVFGHGENNSIIKGKKENSRKADYYDATGERIADLFSQHFKFEST
ncbi:hypothetical protein DS745_22420 [Anaerobacillus alkaliphilus]|uniref:Glycosyltransferase family 2 protein n=1 Tax=Anaerobacillus alkaliphilus TaxID=1548597 RepID=A0A4Q0VMA8_9BACI|nr:hypothetical protein [Anaerobacillus alkaliphilus]RXI96468.1 hypothetical protein DS745_22420 [Anaerobacillus alkaliphilus]